MKLRSFSKVKEIMNRVVKGQISQKRKRFTAIHLMGGWHLDYIKSSKAEIPHPPNHLISKWVKRFNS